MDVRGPPCVLVIAPRIGARLDGQEAVATVGISQQPARSREIRIEGRGMIIVDVGVASGCVRLPDFDECVRHRASVAVKHSTGDNDALSQRLARVLTSEGALSFANILVTKKG